MKYNKPRVERTVLVGKLGVPPSQQDTVAN
jgi:hypothetical protein